MKNIHVLPTNKEQHSIIQKHTGLLLKQTKQKHFSGNKFNLFITSDEEIKEGDWFYLDMSHSNTLPDEIHQMGDDNWSKTGGIHFCEGNTWVNSCKKIILTTDQDLIKDGVQAIDDDELEWFVKNPSYEKVEIFHQDIYSMGKWNRRYKIIIPKEEPKSYFGKKNIESVSIGEETVDIITYEPSYEEYEQETLEEDKNIEYWKSNAEEDYLKVPISVLRYISELEKQQEKVIVRKKYLNYLLVVKRDLEVLNSMIMLKIQK